MFNHFLARLISASLLVPVGLTLGCGGRSPSTPTPPPTQPTAPAALIVTAIYPAVGATSGSMVVTIKGSGFESGATVTLDGVATNATVNNSGQIVTEPPAHSAGRVDVVVTNPDGKSGRLTGGFTYAVFTLTVSRILVTPGGQVSVSWVAPPGGHGDWVGLFRVGDPNTRYGWFEYTKGATSGTLTLSAPTEAGQYEFRYLLDDDFIEAVRSSSLTVN